MSLIAYEVTQTRKIVVAAGTADGALVVAVAQEQGAWTTHNIDVTYKGSADSADIPGNAEYARKDPFGDDPF